MPNHKDLKRLVRTRMAETGENYTQALSAVLSTPGVEPVPAPWRISGTHHVNYRAGLLPGTITYHGSRVVRLRRGRVFARACTRREVRRALDRPRHHRATVSAHGSRA